MNTLPKYRSHTLRAGRASIPGAYYYIIIVTHQRKRILADDNVASIIFRAFNWLEVENRLERICIMVMPDHVHTVIKLGEGQTLTKVLHSMKRFTAREINKCLSREGVLWQKGYSDWGIRTEEALNNTIRYCYMNPVREGLVRSARDYPYWWCKFEME
ncbi:transposase [Candidatus Poribacteria bacterium]|nr:transposase [Candidatus Poribacteria bacterium]MYK19575.1 transposase [Candidatus Poribacteria bacterium]